MPVRPMATTFSLAAKRSFDAQPPPSERNTLGILSFLSEQDLSDLRRLLQTVSPRIMDLVANWYQLYKRQYHERHSLTEAEFQQLFGISLLKTTRYLLENRINDYAAEL